LAIRMSRRTPGSAGSPRREDGARRDGVTDIDAQGLGELAWGVAMMRRSGGQLALIAPNLRVRRLLAVTRLDSILAIYDSERDAITSGSVETITPGPGIVLASC
jgi:STAS domain